MWQSTAFKFLQTNVPSAKQNRLFFARSILHTVLARLLTKVFCERTWEVYTFNVTNNVLGLRSLCRIF